MHLTLRRIPLFLLVLPLFFGACNPDPEGDCSCTVMACFEGVTVELLHAPDTAEYTGLTLAIKYGDTVEAASEAWGFADPDEHSFMSRKLVQQKPKNIKIHLDYLHQGAEKRITLDTTLAWNSRVCNRCSGSSSDCNDQMAHSALVVWDLSLVDFE